MNRTIELVSERRKNENLKSQFSMFSFRLHVLVASFFTGAG
jgi:hypothetical protein